MSRPKIAALLLSFILKISLIASSNNYNSVKDIRFAYLGVTKQGLPFIEESLVHKTGVKIEKKDSNSTNTKNHFLDYSLPTQLFDFYVVIYFDSSSKNPKKLFEIDKNNEVILKDTKAYVIRVLHSFLKDTNKVLNPETKVYFEERIKMADKIFKIDRLICDKWSVNNPYSKIIFNTSSPGLNHTIEAVSHKSDNGEGYLNFFEGLFFGESTQVSTQVENFEYFYKHQLSFAFKLDPNDKDEVRALTIESDSFKIMVEEPTHGKSDLLYIHNNIVNLEPNLPCLFYQLYNLTTKADNNHQIDNYFIDLLNVVEKRKEELDNQSNGNSDINNAGLRSIKNLGLWDILIYLFLFFFGVGVGVGSFWGFNRAKLRRKKRIVSSQVKTLRTR